MGEKEQVKPLCYLAIHLQISNMRVVRVVNWKKYSPRSIFTPGKSCTGKATEMADVPITNFYDPTGLHKGATPTNFCYDRRAIPWLSNVAKWTAFTKRVF